MAGTSAETLFAVRLVDIDFALLKPNGQLCATKSPLTGRSLRRVPVVRIFGATPRGQKTCVHVHGFFIHLLVPFDGVPSDRASLIRLARRLDAEIAARKGRKDDCAGVFDMRVERRTAFYGYHEEARDYLRVELVYPNADDAAKIFLRDQLGIGARQPHHAHVKYLLQFKIEVPRFPGPAPPASLAPASLAPPPRTRTPAVPRPHACLASSPCEPRAS